MSNQAKSKLLRFRVSLMEFKKNDDVPTFKTKTKKLVNLANLTSQATSINRLPSDSLTQSAVNKYMNK